MCKHITSRRRVCTRCIASGCKAYYKQTQSMGKGIVSGRSYIHLNNMDRRYTCPITMLSFDMPAMSRLHLTGRLGSDWFVVLPVLGPTGMGRQIIFLHFYLDLVFYCSYFFTGPLSTYTTAKYNVSLSSHTAIFK
jgi:hypothetical protein